MTRDEFDKLTEAEAYALLRETAEGLMARARRLDALHGECEQTFGRAPELPPEIEAIATTPDASALLEQMDRDHEIRLRSTGESLHDDDAEKSS